MKKYKMDKPPPSLSSGGGVQQVVQLVEDQQAEIELLKAELNFHKERIDKQDQLIKELFTKVEQLSKKGENEEQGNSNNTNEETKNIWKETANLSIAEAVKETAEKAQLTNLGFVFDPATRLYCNYNTGYYYDPAQELFYNGHTGVYYTYNADKQQFVFHSQVQLETDNNNVKQKEGEGKRKPAKTKKHEKEKKRKSSKRKNPPDALDEAVAGEDQEKTDRESKECDVEEGELSSSDSDEKASSFNESDSESCSNNDPEEVEQFPPCIRAIVLESNSPSVKKGSLSIITCDGGTIGREGNTHSITLPDDAAVEKEHAKIVCLASPDDGSTKSWKYFINIVSRDSGTVLNGTELSQPEEHYEIVHGSILKIGGFSILLHIHPGSFTCGHCEPGLLMGSENCSVASNGVNVTDKPKSRNALMKQIKKKYGIERTSPHDQLPDKNLYKDRARERRTIKGSDNPYEKTQIASTEESIGETNKGFKMLAKMGWTTGQSLGSTGNTGVLEPIKMEVKSDRAGLGMSEGISLPNQLKGNTCPQKLQQREDRLAITMKRFKEIAENEVQMDIDDQDTLKKSDSNS